MNEIVLNWDNGIGSATYENQIINDNLHLHYEMDVVQRTKTIYGNYSQPTETIADDPVIHFTCLEVYENKDNLTEKQIEEIILSKIEIY